MKFDYDLVVIGSGAAGLAAVEYASKQKKRIAIVEKGKLGGECPNFACIPAKIFLKSGEIYQQLFDLKKFGVKALSPRFDWQEILARRENLVNKLTGKRLETILANLGVKIFQGEGKFLDKHTLQIGNQHLTADKIIIATGSSPFIPPIPGLQNSNYLTTYDLNFLPKLPKSLAIIGSGPVGCEYATMFNALGVKVYLLERSANILSHTDQEAALYIQNNLQKKGVTIILNANIQKIESNTIYLPQQEIKVKQILVAAGHVPNLDKLNLNKIKLKLDAKGHLSINEYLQTKQSNIYAAGDASSDYLYTHIANYEGRIAAHNALSASKKSYWAKEEQYVPSVTFTNPEIAQIGLTQIAAEEKYGPHNIIIGKYHLPALGRGFVDGIDLGLVKIIASRKDAMVLGATIIGPGAGEMIHELAIVMQNNLTLTAISQTIHAFPTYSEGIRAAAVRILTQL